MAPPAPTLSFFWTLLLALALHQRAATALSSSSSQSSSSSAHVVIPQQSQQSQSQSQQLLLPPGTLEAIRHGQVAVVPRWLDPQLTAALRTDALDLYRQGHFLPDGLTNTALSRRAQGFSAQADRQTFRGGAGWDAADLGDAPARREFGDRMTALRQELARGLGRPSLALDGPKRHEMTFNLYQPGAQLGRHLDEHHEETKGTKGWIMPTRRSVTWLVYLNDDWNGETEGGALRTFPRTEPSQHPVGSHDGNLQVGWWNHNEPVFLDSFRPSGGSALYKLTTTTTPTTRNDKSSTNDNHPDGRAVEQQQILSTADFDVPRQPIDFSIFLPARDRARFEQISTARLDPRFAATTPEGSSQEGSSSLSSSSSLTTAARLEQLLHEKNQGHHVDVAPTAGTLVLFDSVSLPHLVRPVTGQRQRIAATGWFHEDSCFALPS